jgi:hypothetical protein
MTSLGGSGPSYEERPFRFASSLEVITLVVWEILLVSVFMLFSPPMGGANNAVGLPTSLLSRFPVLSSLFFHSLALPLAGVLVLVTISVFDVGERRRYAIKHAITAGCLVSSGAMVFILVTGASLLAYAVMVLGMGLGAGSAVALFLSLWPRRAPSASMRLLGFDLTQLAMWVVVAAALASVTAGSYAALGNSQWGSPSLLGQLPSLEVVHEGLIIAFINAAIVVLIVKWFRADRYLGAPGLLVKAGLYGVLVGTPVVALFAFAAMSTITATTGEITILSSVPMQASVFVMCAVMAEEVRRLHIRGLLGAIRESLTFGLLFLLYWADIAVALPAIYVVANFARFSSQYDATYYLATFQTGNEHALVTLTAVLLFMLVAVMFGVRGKIGGVAGLSLISGYVLSTTADVFYMFNLIPNGSEYVPYIGDGIALMVIGVLVALVGILALSRRQILHSLFPSALNG